MPHKVRELATMGLGRCLKVTLQTRAAENFRSRRWGAERRVARAQTRERGSPSALAEIFTTAIRFHQNLILGVKYAFLGF